jgi:hypothetical protein
LKNYLFGFVCGLALGAHLSALLPLYPKADQPAASAPAVERGCCCSERCKCGPGPCGCKPGEKCNVGCPCANLPKK